MIRHWRLSIIILTLTITLPTLAADWPTYKCDPARTGITSESLSFPMAARWSYRPAQPPSPAWPQPGKELHRIDFDYSFQPVAAAGMVYFGSSTDDTLRAVDAATGALVWQATLGGPIRFAPSIAHGRAYVACDDGHLYCFDAKTGALSWRFQLAPGDDKVLGNGRIVSRWPCRSGAVVVDDIVYATAGMWPTEGVFVYALDADTGHEIWCNDSSGAIYVDLPHPGASGFSGVAPQGYLLVQGDTLLVATGRAVPGAYDRHTGRLLYYKPAAALYHGGSWLTSAGEVYFNSRNHFTNPSEAFAGEMDPRNGDGMFGYGFSSGDVEFTLAGKYRVLAAEGVVYSVGNGSLQAFDLTQLRAASRPAPGSARWNVPWETRVYSMAMAGDTLLLSTRGGITAVAASDGSELWSTEIAGNVRGLIVADGRIIAATEGGEIISFETGYQGEQSVVAETPTPTPVDADRDRLATSIEEQSGKTQGFALIVGQPDARLAEALAARTDLHVISLLPDLAAVVAERERLTFAGVYGSRVWLTRASALADLPPYFADLVVVSAPAPAPAECYHVLHPCGGSLVMPGMGDAAQADFIAAAGIPEDEVAANRTIVRGTLPGAGEWRYPWADAGRTGIGADSRVRLPLEILWFGGPGPDRLMDRHLMSSPPVAANGLVFMAGQDDVIAFDSYNGRELWAQPLPGVGRKYAQYYSSALVADEDSVYAVVGDRCHRFDQRTGRELAVYTIPDEVITGTPPPTVTKYVDVQWPETWQVVGPFPKVVHPIPAEELAAIPESVTVDGKQYAPVQLQAVDGMLDFTNAFGGYGFEPLAPGEEPSDQPRTLGKPDIQLARQTALAFATIDCPQDGKLLVGAGANWWMAWYLDGELVFHTNAGGNEPSRHDLRSRVGYTATDYLFDIDVTAGEHVLAVEVRSGSTGWCLASASQAANATALMPIATGDDPNIPNLRDLTWGYVSAADGLVLGSYNVPIVEGQPAESHLIWRSESKAVFALSKQDGSLRWVHRPPADRTVANLEIAFGDGKLFLVDATSKADSVKARRRGVDIDAQATLIAMDFASGDELWRSDDVPIIGERSALSRLKSNPSHLFMGLPYWDHLLYARNRVVLGVNAAWDATTGEKLWETETRPRKLPLLHGDWIIAQPHAYSIETGEQRMAEDLLTGEEVPWKFPRSYGCGPVNGSQHLLFFRSGADGFFDMNMEATTNLGGIRPNCTRSILAAHGLLIHPEGYSGCSCSYNYQTSLAMVPTDRPADTWYVFGANSREGPIKRLAVNLGAPGDLRDERGTVWLGFPRPMLATACPAPVTVSMDGATSYYHQRVSAQIEGTDAPWLYSSGIRGRGQINVDLALQPSVVIPTLDAAPPAMDGTLDDPCWQQAGMVSFENTPFTMLGASVDMRAFRDSENLYFAFHRKPIPNPKPGIDQSVLDEADTFHIFLTHQKRLPDGIRMIVGRNGTTGVGSTPPAPRPTSGGPRWACRSAR